MPFCFISHFLYSSTAPNKNTPATNEATGNIFIIPSGNTSGNNGNAYTAGIRTPTIFHKISINIIFNKVTTIHESIAKYNIVPTVVDVVNTTICLKAIFSLYIGF